MNLYHFLLGVALFYTSIMMLAYKEEAKEKDKKIRFKDAQIEELRHTLDLSMKKYQQEVRENLEVKRFMEHERYRGNYKSQEI